MSPILAIATIVAAVFVQSCVSYTPNNPNAKRIDLVDLVHSNKDEGVGFKLGGRNYGYWIDSQGVKFIVEGMSGRINLPPTSIATLTENEVCFAPVNNWRGACLYVVIEDDGTYRCYNRFNNGATSAHSCEIVRDPF